jgi:dephospho-CoA kinase
LSGSIASGKSTAARFLALGGYQTVSTRDVLQRHLVATDSPTDRQALRAFGGIVFKQLGQEWLFDRVAALITESGNFVVDALRFPADHNYLERRYGRAFLHLHIVASTRIRERRYLTRGDDLASFARADTDVTESQTFAVGRLANAIVVNEQSLEHFNELVSKTIIQNWGDEVPCL